MSKNSGGPAFPVVAENGLGHIAHGMTLRDYFAAKAMTAFIATTLKEFDSNGQAPKAAQMISAGAYEMADAMLLERSKS